VTGGSLSIGLGGDLPLLMRDIPPMGEGRIVEGLQRGEIVMVRVEAVEGRREETALGRIEVVRGTTVGAAILNRGVWLTELTTEGRMVRRNNQELLTAVEIVRFLAETVMPTLAVETVRGTLNQTETVKGTPGVGGRVTTSPTETLGTTLTTVKGLQLPVIGMTGEVVVVQVELVQAVEQLVAQLSHTGSGRHRKLPELPQAADKKKIRVSI